MINRREDQHVVCHKMYATTANTAASISASKANTQKIRKASPMLDIYNAFEAAPLLVGPLYCEGNG